MKTSLGQLSLMYIGPRLWSEIPENLKTFIFLIWKTIQNVLFSYHYASWSVILVFVLFFCKFVHSASFSAAPLTIPSVQLILPVHGHAFHPLDFFLYSCGALLISMYWPDYCIFHDIFSYPLKRLQFSIGLCQQQGGWWVDPLGLSPTVFVSDM